MVKKKTTKADPSSSATPFDAPDKPYIVLARKYRPTTFDDLIGQSAMVTTLRNAFQSGRIAQGYMLTGVRGVGKTTTARILARALNYEADGVDRPTIDMPSPGVHCKDIMEGRHPDVFEIDAASNTGIDNIREIIDSAQYTPIVARTKVFIIDEVHMLSKGAFNALLKTLEEPPGHVRFIFATTEIRKVPVTILSRCQRFDLRRVEQPVLVKHFRKIAENEGAEAADDALAIIARAAEGSVRDGLSLLDQAIAMGEGGVTAQRVRDMLGLADRSRIFDLAEQIFSGDVASALKTCDELYGDGAEPLQIVNDLAEAVHVVARVKAVGEDPAGEALSVEEKRRATALASQLSMAYLSRGWQMLLKAIDEVGKAPNPQTAVEMAVIRLAYTADLPTPDELIRTLGGEAVISRRRGAPLGEGDAPAPNTPLNANKQAPQSVREERHRNAAEIAESPLAYEDGDVDGALSDDSFDDLGLDDDGSNADFGGQHFAAQSRSYSSFADVVALVGQRRDAKLRHHLEEHVSLVGFDAEAGSIDIHLHDGAPAEIANELREKLNAWTGRRWVVLLSNKAGAETIGSVRRAAEAAERERIKADPSVRAVLDVFPDATLGKIIEPSITPDDADTETQTDGKSRTG